MIDFFLSQLFQIFSSLRFTFFLDAGNSPAPASPEAASRTSPKKKKIAENVAEEKEEEDDIVKQLNELIND